MLDIKVKAFPGITAKRYHAFLGAFAEHARETSLQIDILKLQ